LKLTQNTESQGALQIRHMWWMASELVSHLNRHPGHRQAEDSLRTWKQKQQIRESGNIDELCRADLRPG